MNDSKTVEQILKQNPQKGQESSSQVYRIFLAAGHCKLQTDCKDQTPHSWYLKSTGHDNTTSTCTSPAQHGRIVTSPQLCIQTFIVIKTLSPCLASGKKWCHTTNFTKFLISQPLTLVWPATCTFATNYNRLRYPGMYASIMEQQTFKPFRWL